MFRPLCDRPFIAFTRCCPHWKSRPTDQLSDQSRWGSPWRPEPIVASRQLRMGKPEPEGLGANVDPTEIPDPFLGSWDFVAAMSA